MFKRVICKVCYNDSEIGDVIIKTINYQVKDNNNKKKRPVVYGFIHIQPVVIMGGILMLRQKPLHNNLSPDGLSDLHPSGNAGCSLT